MTLAAENNNGRAQYEMGKLYFFDKGIFERDDAKAYMWFKRSADNNYPYAGHYVAQCHIAGAGVPEDQKKGFENYVPEELTKLDNAIITQLDNAVVMIVCNSTEEAETAISSYIEAYLDTQDDQNTALE